MTNKEPLLVGLLVVNNSYCSNMVCNLSRFQIEEIVSAVSSLVTVTARIVRMITSKLFTRNLALS